MPPPPSDVTIRNLDITGFRYAIEEDDIYDGHGIFVIDSKARIERVTMTQLAKMGLTGQQAGRAHAVQDSRIFLRHSALYGNAAAVGSQDRGEVRLGDGLLFVDEGLAGPKLQTQNEQEADHHSEAQK